MYIYGKNVAKEKINSGEKINKIYLGEKFNDKEVIELIKKKKIKYNIVPNKYLDNRVDGMHQGIILEVDDVETYDLDYLKNIKKDNPTLVMLDHLEDPHNFGAIIRTCEAAGVDGIIIPKDRSVSVNSTVMKTSAGALNNMKICMVTNLNSTIKELKKNGIWIIGTDMVNSVSYTKIDYDIPLALVIGSEGFGISRLVRESCDYVVNIPMVGKVNSLNASVAAGVLIYKIFEKRNF